MDTPICKGGNKWGQDDHFRCSLVDNMYIFNSNPTRLWVDNVKPKPTTKKLKGPTQIRYYQFGFWSVFEPLQIVGISL